MMGYGDLTQVDTTTPGALAGLHFDAAARYLDAYVDFNQIAQYSHGKFHRSITIILGPLAQVGDFEAGAMSIQEAPAFFREAKANLHRAPGSYIDKPELYSAISNSAAIIQTLAAEGIHRDEY